MVSIVIPAYNEGQVITRSLKAILSGAEPGEIEIIVVCNGCTDETAEIARNFGPPVRVIETDLASKSNALNLGDRAALSFPRVYIDADVTVAFETVKALVDRLQAGNVLAVAPRPNINLQKCSRYVRAYYEVRSRLPSAREGIGGSGVYALSQDGRRRFGEFPNFVADDGYVRIQFEAKERETLAHANSTVFAPRKIKDLIRIRARAYYGTMELAELFPEIWKNAGERNHRTIARLARSVWLWPKLLVYCYVNILARRKAVTRWRRSSFKWETDNTSRRSDESLSMSSEV